ncbi:NADH-quinone oxidoreductase subunit J [Pseudarthrobacter phenanthrenivorans]|uniref:NADH-quinone oxidoreductase subunit J n=1 Tax=Pseudarthrobacter phenanthrenivorans TaxID=361575 RepID=UPI002F35AE91
MNQQSFGQRSGPQTGAGAGSHGPAAGGSAPAEAGAAAKGQAAGQKAGSGKLDPNANQAVLGPFTVRDLAVFAGTLILFVASLLPLFGARYNLWNLNNLFFLGLGIILPLIASALFAARRLAPATKIRVGSLSIDQFASVVASFALAFFFLSVAGAYVASLLVGLVGSVVLFAATVLGRFLPYLSGDFKDRPEAPAHLVAREAAVPTRKPRAPKAPKPESGSNQPKGGLKGAGIFGGAGAGSSAVQPGAAGPGPERARSAHVPATAAVPVATAGVAGAATGAEGSHAPAAEAGATAGQAAAPPASPAASAASSPAAASPTSGAPAPAASAPVSTAPEVSDRAPEVDAGPPTQAADVVRPSSAPAVEETRHGDVPAGNAPQPAWEPPAATAVHQQVRADQPIGATVDPAGRSDDTDGHPIHEAFWFAVAQHRTAFDPRTGAPAFVIEPGGWVLALEDRGDEFLVQHTDGRLGVLRDLSNIERG